MQIELWGAETPRTFRPLWVLEELGIEYDHNPIGSRTGETQTKDYKALTQKQKIPLLRDGDFVLSESLAMSRYLITCYGEGIFWTPQSQRDKAREDEWCCHIYGELDETGLYVMRRHGELAHIYGASPEVMTASKAYVEKQLQGIGHHLEGRQSVMSGGFGLADILLMSCIDWAVFYQLSLPEELLTYRAHIAQRPAYQKAMAKNYAKLFGDQNGTA